MIRREVLASGVRSGTGSSDPFQVAPDADIRAELIATADTGGTTLDINVEMSEDGGTTWVAIASLPQIGATTPARTSAVAKAPHSGLLRVSWTVVGTNYTFSVQVRHE